MTMLRTFIALLLLTPALQAGDSLKAINYMTGRWTVSTSFHGENGWVEPQATTRATADTTLGGSFIRLNMPIPFPEANFQFELTLSYDRFNDAYRLAALDDLNGYLDVYEGQMEGGTLVVTNTGTGTAFPDGQGGKVYGKLEITPTETGFLLLGYTASEKSGPFSPYMKMAFTPAE